MMASQSEHHESILSIVYSYTYIVKPEPSASISSVCEKFRLIAQDRSKTFESEYCAAICNSIDDVLNVLSASMQEKLKY